MFYDGEYREEDAEFEPCFSLRKSVQVEGLHIRTLDEGMCLSLIHRGPYRELGRSYEKLLQYASEQGCKLLLPSRDVYLKGPGMIFQGNPKKYLTEIQIPIEASP